MQTEEVKQEENDKQAGEKKPAGLSLPVNTTTTTTTTDWDKVNEGMRQREALGLSGNQNEDLYRQTNPEPDQGRFNAEQKKLRQQQRIQAFSNILTSFIDAAGIANNGNAVVRDYSGNKTLSEKLNELDHNNTAVLAKWRAGAAAAKQADNKALENWLQTVTGNSTSKQQTQDLSGTQANAAVKRASDMEDFNKKQEKITTEQGKREKQKVFAPKSLRSGGSGVYVDLQGGSGEYARMPLQVWNSEYPSLYEELKASGLKAPTKKVQVKKGYKTEEEEVEETNPTQIQMWVRKNEKNIPAASWNRINARLAGQGFGAAGQPEKSAKKALP